MSAFYTMVVTGRDGGRLDLEVTITHPDIGEVVGHPHALACLLEESLQAADVPLGPLAAEILGARVTPRMRFPRLAKHAERIFVDHAEIGPLQAGPGGQRVGSRATLSFTVKDPRWIAHAAPGFSWDSGAF